ncbi:MAG TPA: DNA internalization-related competence protein ComEC/Rec2 [Polyangiaceae bacterium]
MRSDAVLCACAALLAGALAVVAPLPALLAVAALVGLLGRQLGVGRGFACAALFALGAVRAHAALLEFDHAHAQARAFLAAPERCSARARVLSSPTWTRGSVQYMAELCAVECEDRAALPDLTARLYGGPGELARGDELDVIVQIAPIQMFRNLGLADPRPRAARRGSVVSGAVLSAAPSARARGVAAAIDRARGHVRRRIEATFSPAAAPMARALVLGENDLTSEDDSAFKKSGLSHMLAVSGTHLVFAVVALVHALRFVLVRVPFFAAGHDVARSSAAVGAGLALLYADFAGGSGSAWRAAWMLTAALLARALGRKPSGARALGLSLGVGAVVDPLSAFDLSFMLSAAATSGLIWLGQPLARPLERVRWRPLRYVALAAVATLSSMVPCAPLLALLGPELTVAGLLANLIASPFGEIVALPLCLFHGLLGWLPALELGVAHVASGALLIVKAVAHASARATWLAFSVPPPNAWQLAVLVVTAVTLRRLKRAHAALAFICALVTLGILERAAVRAGAPRGVLRVTVLDVGQGDSALVDLPDGRLMIVDAGGFVGSPVDPGASIIAPLLRERRRKRVDIAVLSHPHPDHFGGFLSVVRAVPIAEFWDTGQGEREGAGEQYRQLLAELRRRKIAVRRPGALCGRKHAFGEGELEVLAPCPEFVPGLGANDNSFVLHLRHGTQRALLTGDAEAHEEAALVARFGSRLRSEFLKVGHHGSRTSSGEALIAAVRPRVATISCGMRNRFGHPHVSTLTRLRSAAVLALRTDQLGSIIWQSSGDGFWLSAFGMPRVDETELPRYGNR